MATKSTTAGKTATAKNVVSIAKDVRIKFTQPKKSKKHGDSFVSITTDALRMDNDKTEQIIFGFVDVVYQSIQLRVMRGEKSLDLGGVKFSFTQKFILSLIIDGTEYSLTDIKSDVFSSVQSYSKFKQSGDLANAILQVWNVANGNNPLTKSKELMQVLNVSGKTLLIG